MKTLVTLPQVDEMRSHLEAWSDKPAYVERLFPVLLEYAGRELGERGLQSMFSGAIEVLKVDGMFPPAIESVLYKDVMSLIGVFVKDEDLAAEVRTAVVRISLPEYAS